MTELKEYLLDKERNVMILPFATIVETGNHIAHCESGQVRRSVAERFTDYLIKTVKGEAPWRFYSKQFTEEDLLKMCNSFPDFAMRGIGIGDLSIIEAYNRYKSETPSIHRIRIWSVDAHLSGHYDEVLTPNSLRNE